MAALARRAAGRALAIATIQLLTITSSLGVRAEEPTGAPPAAAPTPSAPPPEAPTPASSTTTPAPSPPRAPGRPRPPPPSIAPFLAFAGALFIAGGGVAAYFVADSAALHDRDTCLARTTSCDDLRGPVRTWDAVALGAWAAAGAVGVVGLVLWANASPSPTSGRATTGLVVYPSGAMVEGTF